MTDTDAELPAALGALVADVVRSARLDASERRAVTAELAAHFADGLSAGATVEELAAAFGDPRDAARLIRRAKRRCRAPAWRLRRVGLYTLAVSLPIVTLPYVLSVVRLYGAEPARGHIVLDAEIDVARRYAERGRALAAAAREAITRADAAGAVERLLASLDVARALGTQRTMAAELARIAVLDDVRAGVALASAELPLGVRERRLLAVRLRDELSARSLAVRADVVGPGLIDLLDQVYATEGDGGRPTATGLRVLQKLKATGQPSRRAVLLEPLYFVAPARRSEVALELDRLRRSVELEASGVESGLLDRHLAQLQDDSWSGLRFIPVVLMNRRIADALRASRRLERDVPGIVAMLDRE